MKSEQEIRTVADEYLRMGVENSARPLYWVLGETLTDAKNRLYLDQNPEVTQ